MESQILAIGWRIDKRIVSYLTGGISAVSAAITGVIRIHLFTFKRAKSIARFPGYKHSSAIHANISGIVRHIASLLLNMTIVTEYNVNGT